MAAADLTSQNAILKTLYPQSEINRLMYVKAPALALIPKREDFKGANLVLALRYAHTAGRSATFGNAKANKGPSKLGKFTVTRVRDYSLYSVDQETIIAASDKGAIVDGLKTEVDAALDAFKRSAAIGIFRNGGGANGRIATSTTLSGTTITLYDANEIVNFEVGDKLNVASDDGTGGALIRAGSVLTVTAVNRNTGVITVDQTLNVAIPTISNNSNTTFGDYIFHDGDYNAKVKGFDAWIPASDPTNTPFFGLDRSVDPLRLGGIRYTNSGGYAIEEVLQKALQLVYRNGGTPDHIFLNDADFFTLVLSLGTRVMYQETKPKDVDIGFEGVRIVGPAGPVKVFADPQCQQGTAWVLQLDTWSFRSAGAWPLFESKDGLRMLREDAADAYEGRIAGYFQMMCDAPGWNCRVTL